MGHQSWTSWFVIFQLDLQRFRIRKWTKRCLSWAGPTKPEPEDPSEGSAGCLSGCWVHRVSSWCRSLSCQWPSTSTSLLSPHRNRMSRTLDPRNLLFNSSSQEWSFHHNLIILFLANFKLTAFCQSIEDHVVLNFCFNGNELHVPRLTKVHGHLQVDLATRCFNFVRVNLDVWTDLLWWRRSSSNWSAVTVCHTNCTVPDPRDKFSAVGD